MPDSEGTREPEWKRRYDDWELGHNDRMERMRQMRADGIERQNQYGNICYRQRRHSTMTSILWQARMGTLQPDWRDRLTTPDYAPLLALDPRNQMHSDMDALVLTELRSMPTADWEPGAGVGWRRALDSWRDAYREVLGHALGVVENVGEILSRANTAQTTMDAIGRGNEILHERDVAMIEALYRAGLCAGGESVDWRSWLRERVAGWPDNPTRATALAELQDPHYHDDWEMLPEYWR